MKILLVHKFFKLTGGAEVFFFEVGRVLKENGHEVAYFSTQDKENIHSEYSQYFIKAPSFKSNSIFKKAKALLDIPYNFEAKRMFSKVLDDFKPDLVHIFGIMTHISPSILHVAKAKNIPVVISCNDYKHICPNYKLFHHGKICEDCKGGKFYKAITNKCCHESFQYSLANSIESYIHSALNIYRKNIDLFLFASDFMANKTVEFWSNSFKWGKLLNPFKIREVNEQGVIGQYGLYFGRLIDEKGVDILIKALTKARDIPFKIVGDGPDFGKLKAEAENQGLYNVEFLGAKWGKELDDIIDNCKFVVVPSIWHENFPYVILQAFAAWKAVIGSNRGGIPELVTEDRGIIYEALDHNDLALKMKHLFTNDALCLEYGINARNFVVSNFSDSNFYMQLMQNYKKVLG